MAYGVSCIIPSYVSFSKKKGSLELVIRNLELWNISIPIEIIIVAVDQEETLSFVNRVQKELRLEIRTISYPIPYDRSGARNIGVENSYYDIVWFLDDDTLVTDFTPLFDILNNWKRNTFACGAKRYWTPIGWNYEWIVSNIKQGFVDILNHSFLPSGINRETGYRDLQEFSFFGNCGLIHKKDFILIGGFDQIKFPSRREDVDIMFRMIIQKFEYIHLYDYITVLHLTHPADVQTLEERQLCHEQFHKREEEYGYRFRVNNLFGIDEMDGKDILEPINHKIK